MCFVFFLSCHTYIFYLDRYLPRQWTIVTAVWAVDVLMTDGLGSLLN